MMELVVVILVVEAAVTGNGGGDTGYNYDATTGTITIDISKIHTTLQTVGTGIALSGPSITFDDRGIIVLRTSTQTRVRALIKKIVPIKAIQSILIVSQ